MPLSEPATTMPRSQKTPRPPRTATTQTRRLYDTDLTDAQWEILAPLLPPPPGGGRPRTIPSPIQYFLQCSMTTDAHSDRSLMVSNVRHLMEAGRTVPTSFGP